MRRLLSLIATSLLLLLALPVLAQSPGVTVIDPQGVLGAQRAAVEQSAQRLADEDAQVIVVAAGDEAGSSPNSAEQHLATLLSQNNIASSADQLAPAQIVFYVAPSTGYTALYYGSRWRSTLDPVYESIIDEQMNPRFAEGDIPGGLAAGIDATHATIDPPTSPLVYVLGGVLLVTVAGLLIVPQLRKRRQAAATLAQAQNRTEQVRRAAGAALADLGQRMEAARATAQYDRLSYAPADVEQLQALQQRAEQAFNAAQAAFRAAEERSRSAATPKSDDYRAMGAEYERAQAQAEQANALLDQLDQRRAQLDQQAGPGAGRSER